MDYSFPRYLLAKQTVDDRAINRQVYETLVSRLPSHAIDIIEVGAGIGTMAARLLRWGLLKRANYSMVDSMQENIDYALGWIPRWGLENGFQVEKTNQNQMRLSDVTRDVHITFECADVFEFIYTNPPHADLLIAHAFLDLLPMPDSLPKLFSLVKPGGLAWLTLNFDGVTTFEPVINPALDAQIERLYHQTMDERSTGGDSRSGRHLFKYLQDAGAEIIAAGSSDWLVYPQNGKYPADEAYFLHFILHFFEQSLTGHRELDAGAFATWLKERHEQVDRGELLYIAHQMDFLVQPQPAKSV
jgi:2-polyprenyl-3-methyl-5-hydroxy-6-metoxy-1,4-benzoquinol methylase